MRSGCVIRSCDCLLICSDDLLHWLNSFFDGSFPVGPVSPPSRLETLKVQVVQVGIHGMLVLAVLGWILPVLPGTPFFLIAWSLGWRPSSDSSKKRKS